MKKLSLLIALCAIVVSASAQLKIVNAGNVGIGTNNLIDKTQPVNLSDPEEYDVEEMRLFQNTPNPFYETTTIQCYLPETIHNVELCVYNMQGVQVKCIPITERGLVDLQIAAGQLSAGVYTYLLIGDGKSSDAKKMILTK